MSQTKETTPPKVAKTMFDKEVAKQLLCKNKKALKTYWPLLLLALLPVLVVYLLLANQKPLPTQVVPDKKATELYKIQNAYIKNVEQRLDELNQRFLTLQNQHAKIIKSIISLKATTSAQGTNTQTSVDLVKKTTLETLDRIGEKIRLNEPFSGLLTSLPKDCSTFAGHKTLQQFSARLPLTFVQLKKTFDDIKKGYKPPKVNNNIPSWLEKIASVFPDAITLLAKDNIKIEKANQTEENPLQPIADALEVQDLRLAYSFTKDLQIQSVKHWAKLVMERISLEEDYSLFAEKVQNWVSQTPSTHEAPPINTTQENLS